MATAKKIVKAVKKLVEPSKKKSAPTSKKIIVSAPINWQKEVQPLIKKYKGKPHPLEYKNPYQLVVMVVLAAQDSDRNINKVAPDFFNAFPDMRALSAATAEAVYPLVSKVRNYRNKTKWLLELASIIKTDQNIPGNLEELTALPGIGRKSANVILHETGKKSEGIIVDLHVVRVAPRLGIAKGTDPKKLEKQMMEVIDEKDWGELGMAISFLGREICRPTNPKCEECLMRDTCEHAKMIS